MKTISIYQVEDTPLGSGGMGRVLRGMDPQGRKVAIKEILPEFASDFEIRTRTEREVEMLQQLNNDSIVKVYDQFPLDGNFYIVMELVEGLNIEQYVQKYGAIPYERATRFMIKILEAMQFVHEKNFVHRDMKPSNIMIRNDERVCILDFGIAKDMGNQGNGTGTVIGTIIGSDGYMSPEQADGFSIDHRADIYALGCVFYYMLTGHHAYNTLASDFETRSNITNTPFPRLSDHCKKSFPPKLQEILDHATNKNMMKRYQSCREFRKDLEMLLPSASSSHTIISKNKVENIFITVGREGCDILVADDLMKVSRSHLDITYRQFTGGRFYVITDHSSNGTLVNGRRLNRGESENVPADGTPPEVFLACDINYPLNWEEVKQLIANKLKDASSDEQENPTGETMLQVDIPMSVQPQKDISFIDAIKLYFTRAFDFKGRSRRKEYWYMALANFCFSIPYYVMSISGNEIKEVRDLYLFVFLICIIPGLSLTVRRLHDIGKDGKTLLFWFGSLFVAAIVASIVFGMVLGGIAAAGSLSVESAHAISTIIGAVISIAFWIKLIIWMATDSQRETNEWGPCPK